MQLNINNPLLEQNWQNFCNHHALGDWHGVWTFYSPKGEINRSSKVIRSFHPSPDKSEVRHQNHHFYPDGKTETKTYGPHTPTTAKSLFLENSFSWGSKTVETSSQFFFETGFRYLDRRLSVVATYENGRFNQVATIPELLGSFDDCSPLDFNSENNNSWKGVSQSITPDLQVSPPEATQWKRLEDLNQNYRTLYFPHASAISCPLQIEKEQEFFLAVQWQATSTVLYRGIRYFNSSGFKKFTLETFTH